MVVSTIFYGQNVTVSIENLKVNGVNLSNGLPIDLGISSSANVTFRVDLAKDQFYTIGNCKVWISVFDNYGGITEHFITNVPQSEFIVGASASYDFDILTSEINFGDGNYLSAVLKQNVQPGTEWESEHIPIIKAPPFELSPSSLTLSCNNTNPVIFTVSHSSGINGTITYQWNIGSGWSGTVNSNMDSVTLTPIDGIVLPSDVSVTPIYNGVPQSTITCNVNRASFSTSATIAGSSSLCSTSYYSVNNLPNDVSVTLWSISDNNIATIHEIGNHAALTATGKGTMTISATLTNLCGQTKTIEKSIIVGSPTVTSYGINGGYDNAAVNSVIHYNVDWQIGITGYEWSVTPNTTCSLGAGPTINDSNSNVYVSTTRFADINMGACIGTYSVSCKAINDCGLTFIGQKFVEVYDPYDKYDNPCDNSWELSSYPNPIKNDGTIFVNRYPPGNPCDDFQFKTTKKTTNKVKIYDFYGNVVYKNEFNINKFRLSDLNLKTGNYILSVFSSNGEDLKRIIIIE